MGLTGQEKKFDIFSRFYTVHQRDRRTDIRRRPASRGNKIGDIQANNVFSPASEVHHLFAVPQAFSSFPLLLYPATRVIMHELFLQITYDKFPNYIAVVIHKTSKAFYSGVISWIVFLQRFDTVGWVTGRACSL